MTPLIVLEKFPPEFMDVFFGLGENVTCSARLLVDLERFACNMYGEAQYSSVNKLRYDLFFIEVPRQIRKVLSAFDGIEVSLLPHLICTLKEQTT